MTYHTTAHLVFAPQVRARAGRTNKKGYSYSKPSLFLIIGMVNLDNKNQILASWCTIFNCENKHNALQRSAIYKCDKYLLTEGYSTLVSLINIVS
jgi:hypothetical protein